MIDNTSDRSIRQAEGVTKWINNQCIGTLEYATGVGKTRCAIIAINKFIKKNPNKDILVIVPTAVLKKQWTDLLKSNRLSKDVTVMVINTAVKRSLRADFLILDEIHRVAALTLLKVFQAVNYTMLLGLTATFERLDGREELLNKYCPVIDTITMEEATLKGWLAPSNTYKVLIDVDDIDIYLQHNKSFLDHFSYFDFDWNDAMGCVTDHKNRVKYVQKLIGVQQNLFSETLKECTVHAFAWSRALQARKQFVFNHPKKIEIANKILEARPDAKAITFNATIAQCEKFNSGFVIHSGKTKKNNALTLEEFSLLDKGVLHSSKSLTEGTDVAGLNLAILLHNTSSATERIQKYGRVVRAEPGKTAEIFSIVINNTMENNWFKKSAKGTTFTELTEGDLDLVLNKQTINKNIKRQKEEKFLFTF